MPNGLWFKLTSWPQRWIGWVGGGCEKWGGRGNKWMNGWVSGSPKLYNVHVFNKIFENTAMLLFYLPTVILDQNK
jgi:hypothetical protein